MCLPSGLSHGPRFVSLERSVGCCVCFTVYLRPPSKASPFMLMVRPRKEALAWLLGGVLQFLRCPKTGACPSGVCNIAGGQAEGMQGSAAGQAALAITWQPRTHRRQALAWLPRTKLFGAKQAAISQLQTKIRATRPPRACPAVHPSNERTVVVHRVPSEGNMELGRPVSSALSFSPAQLAGSEPCAC